MAVVDEVGRPLPASKRTWQAEPVNREQLGESFPKRGGSRWPIPVQRRRILLDPRHSLLAIAFESRLEVARAGSC